MKLVIQGDKIAALVGDDFPTPDLLVDVPDGFDINQAHRFRYNVADGQIVVRVPEEVPMSNARLVLFDHNLLHLVQPAITAMAEPDRTRAQIKFDTGKVLARYDPFTVAIGSNVLGLTEAQLDQLFIEAGQL